MLTSLLFTLIAAVMLSSASPENVIKESITLETGKTYKLQDSEVTKYVIKDPSIVSISKKGKIKALKEGTTKIIAYNNKEKVKIYKVKVYDPQYVSLIAVGDNLYHDRIIKSGKQKDGSYDYTLIYANIKDYIKDIDIKIINQEVILTSDSSKWAGYPSFASPLEAGDAVLDAGFNVIMHATNHSWDKAKSGALDSIRYWKSHKDVTLVGMYENQEDYDNIVVSEYNGVKVAFLNYTYGLNGHKLPSDSTYMVKLLDMKLVTSEIKKAKKLADVVIVFPHWGEEYTNTPNSNQKKMAQQMADAGADLIIGCHPHVIQPLETITSSDGRLVPCYYSLGNFVSNMMQAERCVEAMAKVNIKKVGKKITIEAEAIPLVNFINNDDTKFTVYLLDDYTDEIAKKHESGRLTPKFVKDLWNKVFK